MFKRYPYWGWLGLSLALWCINIVHFHAHRQEMLPVEMANIVNKDLNQREEVFDQFFEEKDLLRRMFTDSLTEKEEQRVNALPFYIYGYDHDTLQFWNNNSVIGVNTDSISPGISIRKNQKGVFIRRVVNLSSKDGQKRLIVLYPLLISYPLENDYLHARFMASEHIPVKTRIVAAPTGGHDEYRLAMKGNTTVGYLDFNQNDIQKWSPDTLLIIMLLMAALTTIAWLQHMAIHLTRGKPRVFAFLIIAALIATTRAGLYVYGLPFHLDTLTLFSPRLYASSIYLSSLGDLFINILLALWLITFIARHTHYKRYLKRIKNESAKKVVAVALMFALIIYVVFFLGIIRSLILDSSISFDVTHFYAINIYTVFGLLAIISITAISCMIVYMINVQLTILVPGRWMRYLLILACSLLLLLITSQLQNSYYWYLSICLIVFMFLLDIPSFPLVSKLFEPHMIIWALIICSFCTGIIRYFNELKEQTARTTYVEQHLSPENDNFIESTFDSTAKKIERDAQLKSFFYKPGATARKAINQHFDNQYLTGGGVNKYQVKVYLFDAEFKGLYNKDTTSYSTLVNEKTESAGTESAYLFYKESILDRHYYLSYIQVYNDTINNVIGYVIIDLDLKKSTTETVYPELLQPMPNKAATGDNEYASAVYINGKLVTQTNDYAFPVNLKYDTLKEQQYYFATNEGISTLYYKISDKRTAVVVHNHSELIEAVTLFSYLFGIQIVIALIIFFYQLYLSNFSGQLFRGRFINLTLRRRVHFAMLVVVLFSFLIIGFVTIKFFSSEYRSSNSNKLQSAMQVAKQSVQDYLAKENAFNTDHLFDTVSKSAAFKYFLTNLANNQKIDINIFDDRGNLYATSQEEIYDKGLISRKMRPDAFYELDNVGRSRVTQNEKVGALSYISAYQPLRDEHGATLGYINVPFFSSEKDLDFQISNILVTLINLYAFIFLVSSLLTVIVTKWITRTFDMITVQFDKLNLEQNERIEWNHDDEIGALVREYNKMVRKVEENAARLAQSERETAWREMAKQVAHEIKNPLTPMKLNIQYLQQAMRNDNPNIKQLTERVSDSIIEQIDNLSYIASEFSDFAKMPEAKPEELDLGELLGKAVELYHNHESVSVTIALPNEKVMVLSDKSQLLRVFTNLLENAKQAIPAERNGQIHVQLTRDQHDVVVTITDNGTGINEEVSKRIFQPYFTTKSSGTGLGLAMTKKIIEFWKGAIWYETKEDEGTSFFIRLPLAEFN